MLFLSLKKRKLCKISLALWLTPESPTVFWTNQTCYPTPLFSQIFPICNIFPIIRPDRPWCSDESVWRLLFYSLFGQPGFCLINSFSVWIFTGNSSFIFFHEGDNKNTLKKNRFHLGNFKHNKNIKEKLKQKFLIEWFLGFIAIQFFNRHQTFLNFQ